MAAYEVKVFSKIVNEAKSIFYNHEIIRDTVSCGKVGSFSSRSCLEPLRERTWELLTLNFVFRKFSATVKVTGVTNIVLLTTFVF